MNRKVESFEQVAFLIGTVCDVKRYTNCSKCLDTGPQSFCYSFYRFVVMLFEVRQLEIRCSGVLSRYCCYGNHVAGSKLNILLSDSRSLKVIRNDTVK